ncbi:hypothetical protein WICPIJ_005996 [Wickerhamomyces pijperi]|uniref:Uncharacterized protein n=1 Tax=Wickerhamomyces pijperi TaxID=599730 RepID=A0A9P8Q2K2_WICPI|nr:hypothetical protein WICPIJ_005996 [Wickerhamomyces pijperi]
MVVDQLFLRDSDWYPSGQSPEARMKALAAIESLDFCVFIGVLMSRYLYWSFWDNSCKKNDAKEESFVETKAPSPSMLLLTCVWILELVNSVSTEVREEQAKSENNGGYLPEARTLDSFVGSEARCFS